MLGWKLVPYGDGCRSRCLWQLLRAMQGRDLQIRGGRRQLLRVPNQLGRGSGGAHVALRVHVSGQPATLGGRRAVRVHRRLRERRDHLRQVRSDHVQGRDLEQRVRRLPVGDERGIHRLHKNHRLHLPRVPVHEDRRRGALLHRLPDRCDLQRAGGTALYARQRELLALQPRLARILHVCACQRLPRHNRRGRERTLPRGARWAALRRVRAGLRHVGRRALHRVPVALRQRARGGQSRQVRGKCDDRYRRFGGHPLGRVRHIVHENPAG
mmetsp:Transcript_40391/g.99760  ORF Transcript_40391/g.99760 Transcript_40391/m.99760 type:complete len:269 (+) Transcript_40391:1233-2039(+)